MSLQTATTVWVEVASYNDLPVNTGKTVRFQGQEVALFKLSNGNLRAIENQCPHKNGVLAEGIVCEDHVFCPMHDRKIQLSTGLVQKPDTGCVKTYNVSIENNMVYIEFPNIQDQ